MTAPICPGLLKSVLKKDILPWINELLNKTFYDDLSHDPQQYSLRMVDCGWHGQVQLMRFKHAASCQRLYALSLKKCSTECISFIFELINFALIISHKIVTFT